MMRNNKAPLPHLQRQISKTASSMSDIDQKFRLPKRYEGSEPSVWVEYIQLALDHKPLNLGQGFPDYPPPKYITNALIEVASNRNLHQYTRGFGHPRLVQALAKLYSKLIGREINPHTEILTTLGAYEALFSSITGHVDEGDEVIIIEPYFDCYEPMVKYAGGIPRYIALKPKKTDSPVLSSADFVLDKDELQGLFNSKTKVLILNTPNNPLGKVFTRDELTLIANLCKKYNVLCISDEVYEWMVYKPYEHVRIATLPGMWERTITIGSAGKTFSVTGWKLGWAYGPANLMFNLQMIHQNSVYTGCTPIQEATAIAFETELARLGSDESYFVSISKELEPKREFMAKFLQEAGMKPIVPEGGYFMMADWSPLESQVDLNSEKDKYKDYRFTKWMTKNIGLQGIPPTAFYNESHKPLGENFVRYCFIKQDKNLQAAADILRKWKSG
ncbi:kynurenine aminotransferase-like isoform X2 [Rhynchophorus ferrugineus]|uniref:kynurenine aminotransferase-like isoform X2 n=1 Tax=Rhynchophorus ferrugineus TaxID=354439 RepID=UPI003FCE23CD